jgi:hypothetical protein
MTRLLLASLLLVGCNRGTTLHEAELTVACGMCIFELGPSNGCYWAAEVDGGHLPVTGPGIPLDHQAHAPGGMCTMPRRAIVTGTRYDDKIMADVFELVPVTDPKAAPAHTHAH